MTQTSIIIKQTVNKVDGSDATMQELHQLRDDIMDLVFARGMETGGTFRLTCFDDDGAEVPLGVPQEACKEKENQNVSCH